MQASKAYFLCMQHGLPLQELFLFPASTIHKRPSVLIDSMMFWPGNLLEARPATLQRSYCSLFINFQWKSCPKQGSGIMLRNSAPTRALSLKSISADALQVRIPARSNKYETGGASLKVPYSGSDLRS